MPVLDGEAPYVYSRPTHPREGELVMRKKLVAGNYEREENILHLWFPEPVDLRDESTVEAFFDEVVGDWISLLSGKAYLLVNYRNLRIRPDQVEAYAKNLKKFQPSLYGTFRYGFEPDATGHFTGVTVTLGNMKLASPAQIFATEAAARDSVKRAKLARTR